MTINRTGVRTRAHVFSRTITVSRHPAGCLSGLRRDLAEWLDGHPRAEDAVTVADELVSNSIRHGSAVDGHVTIRSQRLPEGRLMIAVSDSGRGDGEAPLIEAPPGGFGLPIVKALCASVHTLRADSGWHVEVELAAQPPYVDAPAVDTGEWSETASGEDVPGSGCDDV